MRGLAPFPSRCPYVHLTSAVPRVVPIESDQRRGERTWRRKPALSIVCRRRMDYIGRCWEAQPFYMRSAIFFHLFGLLAVLAASLSFESGHQVWPQARDDAHRRAEGVARGDRPRRQPYRARGMAAGPLPQDGHPLLHRQGQGAFRSRRDHDGVLLYHMSSVYIVPGEKPSPTLHSMLRRLTTTSWMRSVIGPTSSFPRCIRLLSTRQGR